MKITICSSLSFIKEMGEVASELRALGHEVFLPKSAAAVLRGEIALETIAKEKEDGTIVARAIKTDAIRLHYEEVKKGDVVLNPVDDEGIERDQRRARPATRPPDVQGLQGRIHARPARASQRPQA